MTATTTRVVRPMSIAERDAVGMHDEGRTIEEICDQTGLTRPRVAAAVELRDLFEASAMPKTDGTPVTSRIPPPSETRPEARPPDDLAALLDAADTSPQPRARRLAIDIRTGIPVLRGLLANDEQVRKLTAVREVLRKHLAETDAELAELLEDDLDAPPVSKPIDVPVIDRATGLEVPDVPDVPDCRPPLAQPAPVAANGRDPLAYSQDVRGWARSEGFDVGDYGRLPGAAVMAYRNAHPNA